MYCNTTDQLSTTYVFVHYEEWQLHITLCESLDVCYDGPTLSCFFVSFLSWLERKEGKIYNCNWKLYLRSSRYKGVSVVHQACPFRQKIVVRTEVSHMPSTRRVGAALSLGFSVWFLDPWCVCVRCKGKCLQYMHNEATRLRIMVVPALAK